MTGSITGTAKRVQDHRKGVLHEEGSLSCDKADERQSMVCPNPVLSKHVLMQSGPAHSANGTMLRQQLRAGCNDLQPDKCKTCSQIDDDVDDDDDDEEDCRTDFPGCITR